MGGPLECAGEDRALQTDHLILGFGLAVNVAA
jgi:hypothetical protein